MTLYYFLVLILLDRYIRNCTKTDFFMKISILVNFIGIRERKHILLIIIITDNYKFLPKYFRIKAKQIKCFHKLKSVTCSLHLTGFNSRF